MAKVCDITGKKAQVGNIRSHSNIASKRKFSVNLQKKRVLNPATGKHMTIRVSTQGLKLLNKWDREGKQYDLREVIAGK
jgi:large subunit ribosomal protein L28